MAAVVIELQKTSVCLRTASDEEMALFYLVLTLPTLFCDKAVVSFNTELNL